MSALDELLSAVERDALRQRCRDLEVLAGVLADRADGEGQAADDPPPDPSTVSRRPRTRPPA